MTVIKVDIDSLNEFGKYLVDKSIEFDSITKKMNSSIESLSGSWDGVDASNFKSNASCYITNLQALRQSMDALGGTVQGCASKYNERVNTINSLLG